MYQKLTRTEIEDQNKKAHQKHLRIEKLFKENFSGDSEVESSELEIEDWKELRGVLERTGKDKSEALGLYKWWLGKKFWLVDQKTETKYHPSIIIF